MKILMIAPQPFFEPRGTPISVRQRVTGLSRLGHEVDLATYHLGEDVNLPGLEIFRTPVIPGIRSIKVGPSWKKIPLDFLLILKSIGLLFRNNYDVIHSHEEAGFFSIFLAWLFNLPHVYDMHSSLPKQLVNFQFGDNKLMIGFFEFLEKLVINTCSAMITIGPDLEDYVQELNPVVPMQMIENLPLNIDQDFEDIPPEVVEIFSTHNGLSIVYTGTFERYQGVDVLIRSFAKISKNHHDIQMILVGGKPDQIRTNQELVSQLGMDGSIHFTGIVSLEDANAYIHLADILVSPRIEGTSVPLKIYTYLHAGKPILATDIPAHSLVLSSDNACLVEPTVDGLAGGIMRMIEDSHLRAGLSRGSKTLAEEKYGLKQYLSKLESLYDLFKGDEKSEIQYGQDLG
jgi:glycosyltransferase involved in cell wall biosynthesis